MTQLNYVPTFTKVWLCLSTVICIWDSSFLLLRPRTLPGGDLHQFWRPYVLYIEIDKLYYDLKDEFVINQSILSLYECTMNVIALFLLSSKNHNKQLVGTFLAILVNAFTFWKTVFYFQYDLPHASINSYIEFLFLYIIPNGFWVVVPLLNCIRISKRIALQLPSGKTEQVENKTQKIKQS